MQQFIEYCETEQIIESGGSLGDLGMWIYIVRCTVCPQKTHTLDKKFNMSIFNYNAVSEVSVCVEGLR